MSGRLAVTGSVRDNKLRKEKTACPQKVCGQSRRHFGRGVGGSGDCEEPHEAGN